jgi:hypothetical protein
VQRLTVGVDVASLVDADPHAVAGGVRVRGLAGLDLAHHPLVHRAVGQLAGVLPEDRVDALLAPEFDQLLAALLVA